MTTVFSPRPLPGPVARVVRDRLQEAHGSRPFSTTDPRDTVRRVTALLAGLPVATRVYRGGLDLRGIEVDHVWVALERSGGEDAPKLVPGETYVLDAAFPLFEAQFVSVLRRFVVGEADAEELETVAVVADVDARVLGEFPAPMRYLGQPVWSSRT